MPSYGYKHNSDLPQREGREEWNVKIGSFEIVEYDEETGHMVVDMDGDTVKSLVSYGLNRLLEEYCEQVILEAEAESEESAEGLKDGDQSNT